jgi:hypothetical protein
MLITWTGSQQIVNKNSNIDLGFEFDLNSREI